MNFSRLKKPFIPAFALFVVLLLVVTTSHKPKKRTVPDMKECLEIIDQENPYPNIVDHIHKVHEISMLVTNALKPQVRQHIDYDLVSAASLLHDIGKMESLTTDESHLVIGGRIMRKLGYPRVAEIIEDHEIEKSFDPNGPLLEKEIVCFGDTRGMGNQTVGLASRMLDLYKRYNAKENRDLAINFFNLFKRYRLLEEKIRRSVVGNLEDVVTDDTFHRKIANPLKDGKVKIVGDFNFWIPEEVSEAEHKVRVPHGKYYYVFLSEKGKPIIDSSAPFESVPDSEYKKLNYFICE